MDADELQRLSVDEGAATIVYKNGDTRQIAHFDSITVRTNARVAAPPPDRPWSGDQSEFEFEFDDATRGALAAPPGAPATPLLLLEDRRGRRVFSLAEVKDITLESYAPERPWLIVAAASVGAVAGGMLGYAMGGSCNDEWGCMEKGLYAMAGAPIGLGVGLALGFPLTRGLGDYHWAPSDPNASKEHEP